MAAEEGIDAELVEGLLRWHRGQGPRPAGSPDHAGGRGTPRAGDDGEVPGIDGVDVAEVLAAIIDTGELVEMPIGLDPVARRLGLVGGGPAGPEPGAGLVEVPHDDLVADPGGDGVLLSLHELVHRLGGELDVEPVPAGVDPDGTGRWRIAAIGRTLGEHVLVAETDETDLAALLPPMAALFTRHPAATAVAVVSTRTRLAVVVTEADCVPAIDPVAGWSPPALPRPPEPFAVALGRHLERTRPRWDEIARLDEMLVLAPDAGDRYGTVRRILDAELGRPARIPARRAALASMPDLTAGAIVAVIDDVRARRLGGDDLLTRIRSLSGAGAP